MSVLSLELEFKSRYELEKYTREFISTYFETIVKDGDVVPKDYNYGKISNLSDAQLRRILVHYKNIVNERVKPKSQIVTISKYYDNNKLNVHHTFDKVGGSDEEWWFWAFLIIILIIVIFIFYKRRQSA